MARSLIGNTIYGRASLPNHSAFIRILQAYGASSLRNTLSCSRMLSLGAKGVAAGLILLTPVIDL